jgi:putative transposase
MGQLAFPDPPRWGGRRAGAGRKRMGRPGVPHRRRPEHVGRNPLHVTLRKRSELVSLRRWAVFAPIRDAIRRASSDSFKIVHYSVQIDHIHLIIEADDRESLLRGARGLSVRLARAINRALRRRGAVWGDRWHGRALATPREVRNAIRYVLLNFRHHVRGATGLDDRSSAASFDGWIGLPPTDADPPVCPPKTWLLSVGWRRHGLLSPD